MGRLPARRGLCYLLRMVASAPAHHRPGAAWIPLALALAVMLSIGGPGCVPRQELLLPPIDARTQSLLLVVAVPGAPVLVLAEPADSPSFTYALADTARLTLLELPLPLERYLLAPGPVVLAAPSPGSRPLPTWLAGHLLHGPVSEAPRWTPLGEPTHLSELRLPAVELERCAEEGGCAIEETCTLPCPRPAAPDPPAPAALPRFEACPAGWELRALPEPPGAVYCEPFAGGSPTDCPDGQHLFPGSSGCSPLGPCAQGDYADELSGRPGVMFANVRAAPGGDGTSSRPFDSLGAALAAAPPGGIIAIARGEYPESVEITRPVELVGACAGTTILRGAPGASASPALGASGEGARGVTLRRLTLVSDLGPGVTITSGARVLLEDVHATSTSSSALRVDGAEVSLSRVVLAGVMGLHAIRGSTVAGERLQVGPHDAPGSTGVLIDGATAELRSTWVSGVHRGIRALRSPGFRASEVVVEDSGILGIDVLHTTSATIGDFVIRRTRDQGTRVVGLELGASSATITRGLIEDIQGRGAWLHDAAAARVHDLTTRCSGVRSSAPEAPHFGGLEVNSRSSLHASRLLSVGDDGHGISVSNGTERAEDLTVYRRCRGTGSPVPALLIDAGAHADVRRVRITPFEGDALHIGGERTYAHVFDLDIGPSEGDGVQVGCVEGGITTCPVDVLLERVRVAEVLLAAVLVFDAGPVVTRHLQVGAPRPSSRTGLGIEARLLSNVVISTFAVQGASVGVRLATGATIDLSDGVVAGNDLALELDAGARFLDLTDHVLYEDNRQFRSGF